jgi:hypothetical protein
MNMALGTRKCKLLGDTVYASLYYKIRVMDGRNTNLVSVRDKFWKHSNFSNKIFNIGESLIPTVFKSSEHDTKLVIHQFHFNAVSAFAISISRHSIGTSSFPPHRFHYYYIYDTEFTDVK